MGQYKYGPREEMPVDVYFRKAENMPELEWVALQQCRGSGPGHPGAGRRKSCRWYVAANGTWILYEALDISA